MTHRRAFMKSSAGLALTALSYNRILGANEVMQIGLLGTGGRCRHLLKSLVKIPHVRISAVCDVYDKHLADAAALADPKAQKTKRFPEVLANTGIQAVMIASPDHWHVPMTIAACEAGKHVYVEKPLTHEPSEGAAVIAAQKKAKNVVQVGTQQRSMPHIKRGYELVKAGRLGTIHKVHLSWNRNSDRLRKTALNIDPKSVDWTAFCGSAKKQPFDEYRFRNWRWFWDFGGGILTDLMVHWLDVAHWFLNLQHPTRAISAGTHVMSKGIWETPDSIQTLMTYPDNLQVHFEGTFSNARHGAMITFMGTDGTLYIDRGRMEFTPERGRGQAEELNLGGGRKGQDFYDVPDGELLHLTDWIDAIRNGKEPCCPVEAGVSAAAAAHFANQAYRENRVMTFEAQKVIPG